MPTTAIINMRAETAGPVRRSFHCLMHPVFLDRISKADPAMGEKLHNAGTMTPFSISPVMGAKYKVQENQTCWVRICILDDDLEEAFLKTLEKGLWHTPIQLEDHVFHTENVLFGPQPDTPWSGRESYEEMVVHAGLSQSITVRFASPVAFKRGDLHYPLPEPVLIFGNLSRRWNRVSRFQVPNEFDFNRISFSNLDIRTEPYALRKGGTILGAVGKMTFIIRAPEEVVHCCNALLRFAFYAGIGVKTTQGMGMCRVLNARRPQK